MVDVPEPEFGESAPPQATLFDRIKAVAAFKNLRVLYRLPHFSKRTKVCPVCHASGRRFEAQNRYFAIERCDTCGHCYAARMPGHRILDQTYSSFAYWQGDKHHQGIYDVEYSPEWDGFVHARMAVIRRSNLLPDNGTPQSIFEIGCSEGMMLHELNKLGHRTAGSEINTAIAKVGMERLGVEIHCELFEELDLSTQSFDIVISFHTLEHMCDPHVVFRRIHRIVKPEGGVVIEVPTGPEEYENPDHLQFFEEGSLRTLIETFFEEAEIHRNEYENADGVRIASLYGIGRRPKQNGI